MTKIDQKVEQGAKQEVTSEDYAGRERTVF